VERLAKLNHGLSYGLGIREGKKPAGVVGARCSAWSQFHEPQTADSSMALMFNPRTDNVGLVLPLKLKLRVWGQVPEDNLLHRYAPAAEVDSLFRELNH